MRIKLRLLFLLSLFVCRSGSAQVGYQGRRNELSIDAFNLAYQGDLNFMYKLALSESYMLFANYVHSNLTLAMKNPEVYNLSYSDQNTQVFYSYDDIVSGESLFNMTTYGFGFLGTSNFYNMQMPVGIYWGLGLYISSGDMSDIYTLKTGLPGDKMPINYDVNQLNLRFIYGNDFVLTNMLTLDISVAVGFTRGKYTLINEPQSGLASETPFGEYPQITFTGHNATEDWNSDDSGIESATYSKLGLFVQPSIRIGYIF